METGNEQGQPITILIVVAVRLYRDGLAMTLGEHKRFRIAGTAATSLEAQVAMRGLQPNVFVVDISVSDAPSLIRTLRVEQPNSRIIAFAVQEDIVSILKYAEAGADGFVTANGSVVDLIEAIEHSTAGELLCSPRIAAELLRCAARQAKPQTDQNVGFLLTIREQQVVSLLRQGRSNKAIANALHISEATVKNHVHHVLEKLQMTTRSQVVAANHLQFPAFGYRSSSLESRSGSATAPHNDTIGP